MRIIAGETLTRLASLATLSRGEAVNISRRSLGCVLRALGGCDSLLLDWQEKH